MRPDAPDELNDLDEALDTFADAGDFRRDWETAMARPSPLSRSTLTVLAVAAAVLLFAAVRTLGPLLTAPNEGEPENASVAPAPETEPIAPELPPREGVMRVGYGHVVLWQSESEVTSVSVVRPTVATVRATETPGLFLVTGRVPGTTDMVVSTADGEHRVHALEVVAEPLSPNATRALTLGFGSYHLLDARGLDVTIAAPRIAKALWMDETLVLQGRVPGSTDVILQGPDRIEILRLEVTADPRSPAPTTIPIRYGGAELLRFAKPITRITVARDAVVEVIALEGGEGVSLQGRMPGATDMLVELEGGELEHYHLQVRLDEEPTPPTAAPTETVTVTLETGEYGHVSCPNALERDFTESTTLELRGDQLPAACLVLVGGRRAAFQVTGSGAVRCEVAGTELSCDRQTVP